MLRIAFGSHCESQTTRIKGAACAVHAYNVRCTVDQIDLMSGASRVYVIRIRIRHIVSSLVCSTHRVRHRTSLHSHHLTGKPPHFWEHQPLDAYFAFSKCASDPAEASDTGDRPALGRLLEPNRCFARAC